LERLGMQEKEEGVGVRDSDDAGDGKGVVAWASSRTETPPAAR
jgi:hypothetical protein